MLALVLGPAVVWWLFVGLALWSAARFGRLAFWGMTGLGALILVAIWLQISNSVDGGAIGAIDLVILRLTLPITLVGQGLLTWWMLDRVR